MGMKQWFPLCLPLVLLAIDNLAMATPGVNCEIAMLDLHGSPLRTFRSIREIGKELLTNRPYEEHAERISLPFSVQLGSLEIWPHMLVHPQGYIILRGGIDTQNEPSSWSDYDLRIDVAKRINGNAVSQDVSGTCTPLGVGFLCKVREEKVGEYHQVMS